MSYYDALADELVKRYEKLTMEQVHARVMDQLPDHRAHVLDVGAGSGRDAAALAKAGHSVVAVEPSDGMRERAQRLHKSAGIRWVDDELPDLNKVYELADTYDLILLSAVWMHLRPEVRDRAMRKLAGLLNPGGKLIITTRSVEFAGRRTLYRVEPDELIARGKDHGLRFIRQKRSQDLLDRDEVDWSTVVFESTDDGTEALPILRNIIVNDSKFSTYKFGLLRTFLRIAAGAQGMVRMKDDGTVEIPMGLVCLYWLKNYWNPVVAGLGQMRHGQTGFHSDLVALNEEISLYDLRFGARFAGDRANVLHQTLRTIRKALTSDGPLRHITYLESDTPIFGHHNARTPTSTNALELTPAYLASFGTVTVPRHIFHAMERFWVWIEPTVLGEWTAMMRQISGNEHAGIDTLNQALVWPGEDKRDTTQVADIVTSMCKKGPVDGIWTGDAITTRAQCEIDHCIPYSRWFNNSLWNLVPATTRANQQKGDKLPGAELLGADEVRARMTRWWRRAYVDTDDLLSDRDAPLRKTFTYEADASLPGTDLDPDDPDLDEIYQALDWQIRRMRRDQQIESWVG